MLPLVALRSVVPPLSRLLEHVADNGSERQGMVHTLEGYRHSLRNTALRRFRLSGGMVLHTEPHLVNLKISRLVV